MARTKLTENAVQVEPEIETFVMGLDIGYGWVKVTCNGKEIIFPSVAAYAPKLKFESDEILADYPGDQLTDPATDEEWFTGALAVSQTKPAEQIFLQGRDNNPAESMRFRLRMFYSALAKCIPHQHGKTVRVILSTGLPVDHMADAPAMKLAFIGQHVVHANNCDMNVLVDTMYVMPQPKGTIYAHMFNPDGTLNERYYQNRVAVFDIGNVTLDATVDENGKFVNEESGSQEGGVFTVRNRLSDMYEREYGAKPSHGMLESILRERKALVRGKMVDFNGWVEDAIKPLRKSALSFAGRIWDKALEIELILVTGGGTELIGDDIVAVYPQAVLEVDPQMSNARGYLYYALFKLAQAQS